MKKKNKLNKNLFLNKKKADKININNILNNNKKKNDDNDESNNININIKEKNFKDELIIKLKLKKLSNLKNLKSSKIKKHFDFKKNKSNSSLPKINSFYFNNLSKDINNENRNNNFSDIIDNGNTSNINKNNFSNLCLSSNNLIENNSNSSLFIKIKKINSKCINKEKYRLKESLIEKNKNKNLLQNKDLINIYSKNIMNNLNFKSQNSIIKNYNENKSNGIKIKLQ